MLAFLYELDGEHIHIIYLITENKKIKICIYFYGANRLKIPYVVF